MNKGYFIVAATVGLMASGTAVEAAAHHHPMAANPHVCVGAKGLMFGAYQEFLRQHPECKPQTSNGSLTSFSNGQAPKIYVSDRRLKTVIELVDVLENGLRLYAYRYRGDERLFVGVMAQDLLADRCFSHAVVERDGYLAVDYAALGLSVIGAAEMIQAGGRALRLAA
jgi:hypothetical protein